MGYYVTGTVTATVKVTLRVLVQNWEFYGLINDGDDLDNDQASALAEGHLNDHAQFDDQPTENGSVLCATVVGETIVCDFEMDATEVIEIQLDEEEYRLRTWADDAGEIIRNYGKIELEDEINHAWELVDVLHIDVERLTLEGEGEDGQQIEETE